jgi:hypothetical protein
MRLCGDGEKGSAATRAARVPSQICRANSGDVRQHPKVGGSHRVDQIDLLPDYYSLMVMAGPSAKLIWFCLADGAVGRRAEESDPACPDGGARTLTFMSVSAPDK